LPAGSAERSYPAASSVAVLHGGGREEMLEEFPGLYLRGLGFVAGGAFFWVLYFDLKDHLNPEPRRLLVLAYLLGCASAVLSYGAYRLADILGLPAYPGTTIAGILVFCMAPVGPIEEGGKFLVARLFVFRWRHFDEPIDGLVYAGSVAIGFATIENVLYLNHLTWVEQLARAVASPLTHSLFAAIWGFGVSRAFFVARTARSRFLWQAGALLASMAVHGLYDFFLLAYNATYVASLIALVLWLFLIRHARALVHAR
jgi:RsiW-degrading membrane proteinase PrsW (M82 family)